MKKLKIALRIQAKPQKLRTPRAAKIDKRLGKSLSDVLSVVLRKSLGYTPIMSETFKNKSPDVLEGSIEIRSNKDMPSSIKDTIRDSIYLFIKRASAKDHLIKSIDITALDINEVKGGMKAMASKKAGVQRKASFSGLVGIDVDETVLVQFVLDLMTVLWRNFKKSDLEAASQTIAPTVYYGRKLVLKAPSPSKAPMIHIKGNKVMVDNLTFHGSRSEGDDKTFVSNILESSISYLMDQRPGRSKFKLDLDKGDKRRKYKTLLKTFKIMSSDLD